MKEINELKFKELLASTQVSEHKDFLINFENATNVNLNEVTLSNKFKNCKFKGKRIDFTNLSLKPNSDLTHCFSFDNCEFENDVYFKDCYFQEIKFYNISKPVKNLHLALKKLGYFTFECSHNLNQEILNEINITIHNCEIINYLVF